MKTLLLSALALVTVSGAALAEATYTVGQVVPADLKVTDQTGKAHTFGDFRGKNVVLEWTNYECPFVRKFYDAGAMQAQQAATVKDGAVWLSVISSAPGKQGHLKAAEAPAAVAKQGFKGTAVILDEQGSLGKAFGATSTPTMAVLDTTGKLVYVGAIDSVPSFNKDDIAGATNYVKAALADLAAGKPVATPTTKSYGCSVKY
ncbi:MAG: redoxin family protein [Alphaproteobacteria bacterium]|jgi:protein-disulfide isomerase|nr:redoxin family protein [Alphaproteobacteria bacterium]